MLTGDQPRAELELLLPGERRRYLQHEPRLVRAPDGFKLHTVDSSDDPMVLRRWTRSSWAFLNEAPKDKEEVVLGRPQSFACDQFHAARIATGNA